MEENHKKKSKIKYFIYLFIILFIFLYFAGQTGYYENKINNNTILTKEAIKSFEEDVKAGKEVDLKDYVNTEVKAYNNTYSKVGYEISDTIDTLLNKGIDFFIKVTKTLFG